MDNSTKQICKFCNQPCVIVWVYGRVKCSICKVNTDECCRGEVVENDFTIETGSSKADFKIEKD